MHHWAHDHETDYSYQDAHHPESSGHTEVIITFRETVAMPVRYQQPGKLGLDPPVSVSFSIGFSIGFCYFPEGVIHTFIHHGPTAIVILPVLPYFNFPFNLIIEYSNTKRCACIQGTNFLASIVVQQFNSTMVIWVNHSSSHCYSFLSLFGFEGFRSPKWPGVVWAFGSIECLLWLFSIFVAGCHIWLLSPRKGQCFILAGVDIHSSYTFFFFACNASSKTTVHGLAECFIHYQAISLNTASEQETRIITREVKQCAHYHEID